VGCSPINTGTARRLSAENLAAPSGPHLHRLSTGGARDLLADDAALLDVRSFLLLMAAERRSPSPPPPPPQLMDLRTFLLSASPPPPAQRRRPPPPAAATKGARHILLVATILPHAHFLS